MLEEIRYADSGALIADIVRGFLPAERISTADYAAARRWLNNPGGGYVGRWQHDEAPYTVTPMRCVDLESHLSVAVVGPGQSAKTSIAENWLLKNVGADPADMLWYMQTAEGADAYVKSRINPMIDAHKEMTDRLGRLPVDNSLSFKRFDGMTVEFLSATPSNLINKKAPRIVADEIDAYPPSLGDVKALLDVRRQTFGRQSMLLAMSHCDRARGLTPERGDWAAGIMAFYADSDRRVWYWPCPSCGAWSSPVPTALRVMTIEYPADAPLDAVEREARLVCPVNGCLIENHERRAMNIAAFNTPFEGWIGAGQEIDEGGTVRGELVPRDTAGFWIVGAMSLFAFGGIGGLARARAKAERDFAQAADDESEATLRQVVVKQWGVPYRRPKTVGSLDAKDLADRAEGDLHLGVVPAGARFLTLGIDCQIAHFEWLVRGWGVGGESWVIETGRVAADPATSAEDWDQLLELIGRAWPLAGDTAKTMKLRGVGFDSAGAPGVTQQAYAAWTRWRKDRQARLLGRISGRDVWSIVPLKGASGANAPRLQVTYPDTMRAANKKAGGGTVPVASFNPNLFKDDLSGQLARAASGAWCVHIPAALRSQEPPHVWFEQVTAEERDKAGRWTKKQPSARNEATDLMVMTHVVARLHGVGRIDWTRPPAWAAEWDKNALIVKPDAPVAETMPPPAPPSDANAVRPAAPIKPAPPAKRPHIFRSAFMSRRV